MSCNNRQEPIGEIARMRHAASFEGPAPDIEFGCDVFDNETMAKYVSKETFNRTQEALESGTPLSRETADDVAQGMYRWATERGATHFTHWFLPLNGSTAEKHDAFLEIENGKAIMKFSGKNLILGEPDASSFPSGGLRSTFEARGCTAWDPTSPAFIKRHGNGATLCIPTAFFSNTGDALDRKTPLLRSLQALNASTRRLMKCFGKPSGKVTVSLGAEQEYFLIDRQYYLRRPDLIQTGRTVFGAAPAKHQQLEDHYFGSIRTRILNFMTEVERDLWRLGIPAKTRHNEVAPCQFELAPLFEEVNLACDHNMLVMEVLRQTAERNGLVCLLHEKPFNGINGSGKHNNWSISYDGRNLLNPGDNPGENAVFLTVLCAVIEAVDLHADLLRASVAGAGNDHRLGAHEAPPAIVSVYLGEQLTAVIEKLVTGSESGHKESRLKVGVDALPALPKSITDRNRTSPFAFTGNKFEFRAPGSSQSCSGPNVIINTIVAEAFDRMAQTLEKFDPEDFNDRLTTHLRKTIRSHRRIIFNGDGYTEDWIREAEKRGLANLPTTPAALAALSDDDNAAMFEKYGVFSRRELASRAEVFAADYQRRIHIEARIAREMAATMIRPAAMRDLDETLHAIRSAMDTNISAGVKAMVGHADAIGALVDELEVRICDLKSCPEDDPRGTTVRMARLRETVDAIEKLVADDLWPLPKYREMLFIC
ncbi:MAG: glutamine synthetase III [Victivallaceae bacterium]|nr:glutamine synthetase III [Victivallaceae bacterium]